MCGELEYGKDRLGQQCGVIRLQASFVISISEGETEETYGHTHTHTHTKSSAKEKVSKLIELALVYQCSTTSKENNLPPVVTLLNSKPGIKVASYWLRNIKSLLPLDGTISYTRSATWRQTFPRTAKVGVDKPKFNCTQLIIDN